MAATRGQTNHGLYWNILELISQKMVGFLFVRVEDQVVDKAFQQFVYPGGQGPLVANHTKTPQNRTFCRQVRVIDRSTDIENPAQEQP